MDERYDIAVIGAGIVGVSTALHLLMHRKKVLLVDRLGPGQATSYGNAGIIGNCYVLPFGFPRWTEIVKILLDRNTSSRIHYSSIRRHIPWLFNFYMQSRDRERRLSADCLWPLMENSTADHTNLMRGTEAQRFLKTGTRVSLYRREFTFMEDAPFFAAAHEKNVPFEVMNQDVFCELEPYVKPAFTKAVRWTTSAQLKNPGAVTETYATHFAHEGGSFLHADVSSLTYSNDNLWGLTTNQKSVQASNIVVCTGPYAANLLKNLGYSFPLALKRGYHQHYTATRGATLSHTLVDMEYGYALSLMEQGYRLTTGTEFANPESSPSPKQLLEGTCRARELFPLEKALDPQPWMGNRPCFADSLPIIGPSPRHRGLWFNFGHGHMGMTIGPSSGRLLAEMITNSPPFCDPTPYRADRF